MRKLFHYTIKILLLVSLLSSCSKEQNQFSDNDVFRYNESANIQTLDPAFARSQAIIWPCNHLYNGLVQLNDTLHIEPDIAKSWTISEDGTIYTFTLRNDVYFHKHPNFGADSTRNVRAQDFVYSFNRILDSKIASPGAWIFQQVASYKALNDSVFQVQLKQPFPAFLSLLSMKYASVVPREIVEDKTIDFRSNPIGTGPFQFKIWEENIKLVLRRNPNYHEKDSQGRRLPYLESIAITFLPDKQSAFLQFIQGKIDFISGLDASYKDEILQANGQIQPKYKNKFNLETAPYLNTEYLGFNMNDTTIFTKKLRKILSQSIDRQKMIAYLKNGIGDAEVFGIIPNGLGNYKNLQPETFNRQEAIDYIKSRQPLSITLSTNPSYADIAEFLQREWQKLGIKVQVDALPPSTLRQSIATNKVAFFRASWIADYPDAENYLALFHSANHTPNGPNYTHYTNPQYDQLYQKALQTTDPIQRQKIYAQMNQIIAEDAPVLILFYDQTIRLTQNNVHNLTPNAMNNLQLKKVFKK